MCGCAKADIDKWPEAEGYTEADMNWLVEEITKIAPEEVMLVDLYKVHLNMEIFVHVDITIVEKKLHTEAEQAAFLSQLESDINLALQKNDDLPKCFVSRRIPMTVQYGGWPATVS